MTKNGRHNCIRMFSRRLIAFLLAVAVLFPVSMTTDRETVLAGGILKLSAAKSVAVARSDKIESLELQITTKRAARDSAVRSLREKQHNMSTFRWSPLLNFKFPTKPSEAEAFEFQYKPTQLEYQIKDLMHKITDVKLQEYEKVSNLYIGIIQAQQELEYVNKRLENIDTALKKAQARQKIGEVSQDVVDKLMERQKTLQSKKSEQETKFQRNKEKLGKELKIDITTNYIFEDAFATAEMSRKNIEYLQEYALERDHTVYEAQQSADLALLSLETNYSLFRGQYGAYIGTISSYVQQAMDGSDVNQKAYTKAYDKFLQQIDSPWEGDYKILFIRFPKSYLKGDNDGMNWIEDDPKVLFTDTMDYVAARKELENTKEEIRSAVEDGYDTYAGSRKAYIEANGNMLELQSKLVADEVRNLMGEISDEEFETERQEYEAAESANNEALGAYSQTLYSFDRTTCGGVSQFLETASASESDGNDLNKQLNSLEGVTKTGAHYSIRSIISDAEFIVTIDVPDYNAQEFLEDGEKNPEYYPWNITDFELRINGRTIGSKTPKDGSVRHLKLDKDNADEVVIRLWDVDEFIDDVVIDPTIPWGPLDITVKYETPEGKEAGVIGTYELEDDTTTDMIRMNFHFDQDQVKKEFGQGKEAAYYNLSADRTLYLFSDHLVSIDQPFSYLSFIRGDLGQLTMRVFDSDGTFLGGARFDTTNQRLVKDGDVMLADMQGVALNELATKNKKDQLTAELLEAQQALRDAEEVGDLVTADYYKNRIAALQDQIDHAAENLTEEDLEKVRSEQAEELSQLTEEKAAEASKSDEEKAKDAEDALKKQQILRDAAEELVGKQKFEEDMADLRNQRDAWAYKETELQERFNQLSKEKGASDPEAKEVLAQLQAAKRKKRALEDEIKSHSAFDRTAYPVSEEEIQEMLNLHPEDVYNLASDRLTDLDTFAGPAFEQAKAEAEIYGIETTTENVQFLMGYTEELKQCKAIQKQMDIMKKDKENLEKQMADIQALPDDDPRKLSQSTILSQLEKVNAAYEKQLETLRKQEDRLNPAKELKRRQIAAEIKAETETLNELEQVRDEAKQVFDDATEELYFQEKKLADNRQNKILYEKQLEREKQNVENYTALYQYNEQKARDYQDELDDMNWFERAGQAIKGFFGGETVEMKRDKARNNAQVYGEKAERAREAVEDLTNNKIPAAEQAIKEAEEAIPIARKAKDDAEVPYNAAEEDVTDQNSRIEALKKQLAAI